MSKKSKVVGSMSEWSGLLKDFFRQIDDGGINQRQLQCFLEHKNPFRIHVPKGEDVTSEIFDWETFYAGLGITCDLSGVRVPRNMGGLNRVIIMARGITPQSGFNLCSKNFQCWKWTDRNLDEIVVSDRTAKDGPYAIRVRDRVESDEELKILSADQLKQMGIAGITLEERLIYELKYFKETGEHLDIQKVTLCAGSRIYDGSAPLVDWNGGRLGVGWSNVDDASDDLRARAAVS